VPPSTQVLSVGYEGRSLAEFVDILQEAGVKRLLDVREVACSRRAEYRKASLERALMAAGIEYRHLAEAGNPYRHEKDNIALCLDAYRSHLEKNPTVLESVVKALGRSPVAVLCYERAHDSCHRSVLLRAVMQSGRRLRLVTVE
jgi:uncharacterized protein (DUF488 family)